MFVTLACKNTGRKETYNASCALECFACAVGGMSKVKYHQAAVQIYRYEQSEIPPAHKCLSRLRVKIRAEKETYNVSCALECFASVAGGINEVKYH